MSFPAQSNSFRVRQYRRCESRVRRAAIKQGLLLQKSRARNRNDYLFGTYQLIDPIIGIMVLSDHVYGLGFGCTLEECAQFLEDRRKARAA